MDFRLRAFWPDAGDGVHWLPAAVGSEGYFATTVGTNMASEVPWIGAGLKRLMRGGNEMGTLTLSRFFVAHVFLLPAAVLGLVAAHVYFFRKAGAAGPPSEIR